MALTKSKKKKRMDQSVKTRLEKERKPPRYGGRRAEVLPGARISTPAKDTSTLFSSSPSSRLMASSSRLLSRTSDRLSSRDLDKLSTLRSDANSRYQYTKLPNPDSIRLLALLPGREEDPLICSLIIADIAAAPTYAAISYVWGDPKNTVMITVDEKNQPVTVNLRDVFLRARHESNTRILWADAICINQEDLVERAQQIRLMPSIFGNAEHVLAWLGKDDGDAEEVSTLIHETATSVQEQIKKLGGIENMPEVQPDDLVRYKTSTWTSLAKMLNRPWFSRCWIVQEICLAEIVIALCGNTIIDWDELITLSVWVSSKGSVLQEYFDLAAVLSLSTMMLPYRIVTGQQRVEGFAGALSRGRSYEASDPRDHIYAFLSHPSTVWEGKLILQPYYTKTVRELYIEVALQILKSSGNLNLLTEVEHILKVDLNSHFPSWVPQWDNRKRCNPLDGGFTYTAAGYETLCEIAYSSGVLKARGIRFDVVHEHSDTFFHREFLIPRSDEEPIFANGLLGRIMDQFYRVEGLLSIHSRNFWETMSIILTAGMIDLDPAENNISGHLANFLAYLFELYERALAGNTNVVCPNTFDNLRESSQGGNWARFMADASSTCHRRKLFYTQKGYIGVGPEAMEEGDLCCILFGARVPYILRRVGHQCVLVGESYIHGVMRGEIVDIWQNGDLETEYFELR